jgi:hypothetical protein
MESDVCDKQKLQGRLIIQLQIVWHNKMFKYSVITLEASDIILLMFSNSFDQLLEWRTGWKSLI